MSSDRIHFGSLEGELKRQSSDEDDEVPPESNLQWVVLRF